MSNAQILAEIQIGAFFVISLQYQYFYEDQFLSDTLELKVFNEGFVWQ